MEIECSQHTICIPCWKQHFIMLPIHQKNKKRKQLFWESAKIGICVRKRASARLRATRAALTCVFSLCAARRGLSQPPPHKERQTRHKDIMSYNSEIDAPLLLRGFGRWWLSREMLKRLNSFWPLVPLCDATCGWCMAHSNPKCARQRDIWCTSILSALSVCVYWNLALEFEKQIRMCLSFVARKCCSR